MKDRAKLFVYKNGRNAVLWFILFAICLYGVRVSELYMRIDSYAGQSVDGLSKNAIFFRVDGTGDIDLDFLSDEKKPYAILSQAYTSIPMYLVYQSHDFFETCSGRSFTADDATDGQAFMLCGKYAADIYDTSSIYWQGKGPYVQIGELSESGSLLTDYGIFLNEQLKGSGLPGGILILEARGHRDCEHLYDVIEKNLITKGFNTIRLDINNVRIGMMTDSEKHALIMILVSVIFLSVSIGFVTVFWLTQYDEERYARFLCGQAMKNRVIVADYLIIQITAFSVGIGIAILMHRLIDILTTAILFGICMILFMVFLCIRNLFDKYACHKERRGIIP